MGEADFAVLNFDVIHKYFGIQNLEQTKQIDFGYESILEWEKPIALHKDVGVFQNACRGASNNRFTIQNLSDV